MVRKIQSFEDIRVDVVDAIKRAFIKKGLVPRPRKPAATWRVESTSTDQTDSPPGQLKEPEKPAPKPAEKKSASSPPEPEAEPQDVHEKLIDITEKAQDILFQADTVFPFTLFPDTITVDREKLTVATRYFFKVAKVVSVPIGSISSAEVDVGPFFGSLHMASKFFVQNKYTISFLWRSKALNLQHLLQGFMIAQEKNIDVTDIEKSDLLILLKDLGQGVDD
jgi:hypothetical protein